MLPMEQIISNLLAADSTLIQQGTNDLKEAFKTQDSVRQLCDITVAHQEPQMRQYSAVLLRKHLNKTHNWQMVPTDQQDIIKQGMLQAFLREPEKSVRTAIAGLIGVIVRHEAEKKEPWMANVLQVIFAHCASTDPQESLLGATIFATLADVAPDQFVPYMDSVCQMFNSALESTENSGNPASMIVFNILVGMTNLVPFILGHNNAEETYQKSIPLIVRSLQAFAYNNDSTQFIRAFDILESMADYTPSLLTNNIRILIDFCLTTSNNAALAGPVRVRTVSYIGWLVRLKKKVIVKNKYVEPIVQVVFSLMCSEMDSDNDEEEYFLSDDNTNPMTTATQTMDLLALNVPPEKLIPPLLALLEPALQSQQAVSRRAAFLSMAVIAEGCSEAICSKYLETMLNIIKAGINDSSTLVRNAAFFALGQFSEHLQPDITKYAPEILPVLFDFLVQLCAELKSGNDGPKHIDRMFYALETFSENLGDALVPHLPVLMDRLFEAMNPSYSERVRELAMSAISAASNAAKSHMMPYFNKLIVMLKEYLVDTKDEDIISLRPQAIETLAALARTVGRENFMPLAADTINFALTLLEDAEDPDLRRALYNLLASLADVVNEEMASVYPKIIDRIYDSILSTDEVVPEFKNDVNIPNINKDLDNDQEIDIEFSDDEEIENLTGYSVENAYLDEKEEAILALREFAEHTGKAFLPYIEQSYQNVYKMIDHPQEDVRKVAVDALAVFILALFRLDNIPAASSAAAIYIPKMSRIIHEDEEIGVALSALESMTDILKEMKHHALPDDSLRDIVFDCVSDVLAGKVACQFDDPTYSPDNTSDESEYDEAIIDAAGNLLPALGEALEPQVFAMYFDRIYQVILEKLKKGKADDNETQRSFAYGTLAECLGGLKKLSANYFDQFCPLFLAGIKDQSPQTRQNAVFGLGELVLRSEEVSFGAFPTILQALSELVAKETTPACLDNICGAIARLIITNYSLVPLEQVLPVYLRNLPLREDLQETAPIFRSFKILYMQARPALEPRMEQLLAIAIHVLVKNEHQTPEVHGIALDLIKDMRAQYPDVYTAVTSVNPDIIAFLHTLL